MPPLSSGALLLLFLGGCSLSDDAVAEQAPPRLRVRTALVEPLPTWREVGLQGVTRSREQGAIGFVVAGRLARRDVQVGDVVEAGDVLAQLDVAGLRHGLRAAEATVADLESRLAQLGRDRSRLEDLGATGSASTAEVERIRAEETSVRANLDVARTAAAEARRQLDEGVLRAPFAGIVSAVHAEPGEIVAPGAPIVSLTGRGTEIALQVPERIWVALRPGSPVSVRLPALDRTVEARVETVSGASAPGGLFPVVVGLDEPLASGLTAEVTLSLPQEPGMAVPLRALVDPVGTGPVVYRIEDGAVVRVPVQTGLLHGDRVAVHGELEVGDEVVVAGHARLLDGDAVEVLR